MKTILLAKKSIGSVGKYVWTKAGAEGAIEVEARFAYELLAIPKNDYSIVEPKDNKKADVPPAPKPEPKVEEEAKVEETATSELSDAIEVASPTKRRTKG